MKTRIPAIVQKFTIGLAFLSLIPFAAYSQVRRCDITRPQADELIKWCKYELDGNQSGISIDCTQSGNSLRGKDFTEICLDYYFVQEEWHPIIEIKFDRLLLIENSFAQMVLNDQYRSGVSFRGTNMTLIGLDEVDLTSVVFDGATLDNTSFVDSTLDYASFVGAKIGAGFIAQAKSFTHAVFDKAIFDNSSGGEDPFEGKDMSYASFKGATLGGRTLRLAKLEHADFSGTDLSDSDQDHNFSYTNLRYAKFVGADLTGMDFRGASLDYADFTSSTFYRANLSSSPTITYAIFKHVNLKEYDFVNLDLTGVDFTHAYLKGANFNSTTFQDAIFDYANLSEIELTNSPIYEAKSFIHTVFDKVNLTHFADHDLFEGKDMSYASFKGTQLGGGTLRLAKLENADFSGNDLSGTNHHNFSDTNLRYAKFVGANLTGMNFEGASLDYADFTNATFSAVNLNGATLNQAIFKGAQLAGQNFNGADLKGTNFTETSFQGAQLQGAVFDSDTTLTNASFEGVNLTQVDFSQVSSFEGVNFKNANLTGQNFEGKSLNNANFEGADLTSANLRNANLEGAVFYNSTVLTGAQMEGAILRGATIGATVFSSQNLTGANFAEATLTGTIFEHANLVETNFHQATLTNVDFNNARLTNAQLTAVTFGESDTAHVTHFACSYLGGVDFSDTIISKYMDFGYALVLLPKDCPTGICGEDTNYSSYGPTTLPSVTHAIECPDTSHAKCSGSQWSLGNNWTTTKCGKPYQRWTPPKP